MNIGYLPMPHLHGIMDAIDPAMRWDGKENVTEWQKRARERLAEVLGFHEIEKYAVKPEIEIEYDRYAEDLDCREIRFRLKTEEDVTIPAHLCVPANAKGPLPVVITLQGHATGMHISLRRPKYLPGDEQDCKDGDRDFVARALKEGICGIAFEQRCFGENGANPDNGNPDCRQASMRALMLGRSMVGERVWDIMRLIDAISERFADLVDVNKIMCLGNSGGGTATIYAAAMDERIKVGVPSCAVSRYADSIGAMVHCNCNYVAGIAKDFDMGDLCAMVAPRTLVVVNGVKDGIFPINGAKACVEVGRQAYKAYGCEESIIHVIGEGGHRFYADPSWPHIHKALENL